MWTCIECEFKYTDDNGDSEERMCETCLNKRVKYLEDKIHFYISDCCGANAVMSKPIVVENYVLTEGTCSVCKKESKFADKYGVWNGGEYE